ncbi:hypothetical protein GCM10018954_012730 [Kutzneria kofuensis]
MVGYRSDGLDGRSYVATTTRTNSTKPTATNAATCNATAASKVWPPPSPAPWHRRTFDIKVTGIHPFGEYSGR